MAWIKFRPVVKGSSCEELQKFLGHGMPPKTVLFPSLHPYYSALANFLEIVGQVLSQDGLVIPAALRLDVLKSLGHQGLTRCRAHARMSVWWPRINAEITQTVSACKFCIENQPSQRN